MLNEFFGIEEKIVDVLKGKGFVLNDISENDDSFKMELYFPIQFENQYNEINFQIEYIDEKDFLSKLKNELVNFAIYSEIKKYGFDKQITLDISTDVFKAFAEVLNEI